MKFLQHSNEIYKFLLHFILVNSSEESQIKENFNN